MRLDSVRVLEAELAGPGPGGTVAAAPGRAAPDVPATRLAELGPVRPGVALGIAPAGPVLGRLGARLA